MDLHAAESNRPHRPIADSPEFINTTHGTTPPEPIEQYVPGVAGGRHYMARLCQMPDGLWRIDVIHVASLAPVHGRETTWTTREKAALAADRLVGALSC